MKAEWIALYECQPLDVALETAREWLEEHKDHESVRLQEVRPAESADLPDYTADVIERLSTWLYEDETLCHDNGAPELCPEPVKGTALEELRYALRAYLNEHVDLSGAAWQGTGRCLLVTMDSYSLLDPSGSPDSPSGKDQGSLK